MAPHGALIDTADARDLDEAQPGKEMPFDQFGQLGIGPGQRIECVIDLHQLAKGMIGSDLTLVQIGALQAAPMARAEHLPSQINHDLAHRAGKQTVEVNAVVEVGQIATKVLKRLLLS